MVPRARRRRNCRRCEPPRCIQLLVALTTTLTVTACCVSGALLLLGLDESVLLVYRSFPSSILAAFLFFVSLLAVTNCSMAYFGLHLESKFLLTIVLLVGFVTLALQIAASMTTIALADDNFLRDGINNSILERCNNSKIKDLQAELSCCVYGCPITNCTSHEKPNDCVTVLSNHLKDVLYASFGVDLLVLILEVFSTYLMCYGVSLIRRYEHYDII